MGAFLVPPGNHTDRSRSWPAFRAARRFSTPARFGGSRCRADRGSSVPGVMGIVRAGVKAGGMARGKANMCPGGRRGDRRRDGPSGRRRDRPRDRPLASAATSPLAGARKRIVQAAGTETDKERKRNRHAPEKEITKARKKKKLAPGSGSWRPATFGHYGYPYPAIAGRVGASVFLLKS